MAIEPRFSWIPRTDTERRFVLTVIGLAVAVVFVAAGWIKPAEFLQTLGILLGILLVANALDSGLSRAATKITASMHPPPYIPPPAPTDFAERRNTPYELRAAAPDEPTPISGRWRAPKGE